MHFVLLEMSRRFGARSQNEDGIIGMLGQNLYRQIVEPLRTNRASG